MVVNGRRKNQYMGTGSSSAHAYYVTKWRTTYTQYILHVEKKWRLGEVNMFENGCILEMRLRKWSGFMCKLKPVVERVSS